MSCSGSHKPPTGSVWRSSSYHAFTNKEGWRGTCSGCRKTRAILPTSIRLTKDRRGNLFAVGGKIIKHQSGKAAKTRKRIFAASSVTPKRIRQSSKYDRASREYVDSYNSAINGLMKQIHGRTKMDSDLGKAWIMGTLDGFADAGNERRKKMFIKFLKTEKGVDV